MPRRLTPLILLLGYSLAARGLPAQDVGTASVMAGAVTATSPTGGVRVGGNASLAFVFGSFSLGPEIGWYAVGDRRQSPSRRPENVTTLGAVSRLEAGRSAWRPYLVAAASVEFWESTRAGYSTGATIGLGGGAGVSRPGRPLGFIGEVRWTGSVENEGYTRRAFLVATVGLTWRW